MKGNSKKGKADKNQANDLDNLDAILKDLDLQEQQSNLKQASKKKAKGKQSQNAQVNLSENDTVEKNETSNVPVQQTYIEEINALKPIDQQFLSPDDYPHGQICEYKMDKDDRTAINRFTNEEKKSIG